MGKAMTLSKNRDCIFTAIFDPGEDIWYTVKVYRDGNPIYLDSFATQDEAEDFADEMRKDYDAANGQFGVGA